MKEVGAVIGLLGEVLYWHEPEGASGAALPDSRKLWEVMLDTYQKGILAGFAHSHPGSGWPAPSYEDITTFAAIERGLGTRLTWWIASSDRLIALRSSLDYPRSYASASIEPGFGEAILAPWVAELRARSGYTPSRKDLLNATKCPPGFFCIHEPKCSGTR